MKRFFTLSWEKGVGIGFFSTKQIELDKTNSTMFSPMAIVIFKGRNACFQTSRISNSQTQNFKALQIPNSRILKKFNVQAFLKL